MWQDDMKHLWAIWCKRMLAAWVLTAFLATTLMTADVAQAVFNLPQPGQMVGLSPEFAPAVLKGVSVHPKDPLLFDFVVDAGESGLSGQALTNETTRLVKYFLAGLAVPADELWVNLSPVEKDRIMAEPLSHTDAGRELLAQDYILKQITSSLMYPEKDLGREFWGQIYSRAYTTLGTTEVPVDAFNKVWIMPDEAVVYQNGNHAFISKQHLKVMLESDYAAAKGTAPGQVDVPMEVARDVMRSVILPVLEKEVNEGKNFAALRQVFHSLILAGWYKNALKASLLGQVYAGTNKVSGIDTDERNAREKVYTQYLQAYQQGVYNYVREEFDAAAQEVMPRRYFAGGANFAEAVKPEIITDAAQLPQDESGESPPVRMRYRMVAQRIADFVGLDRLRNILDEKVVNGYEPEKMEQEAAALKLSVMLTRRGIDVERADKLAKMVVGQLGYNMDAVHTVIDVMAWTLEKRFVEEDEDGPVPAFGEKFALVSGPRKVPDNDSTEIRFDPEKQHVLKALDAARGLLSEFGFRMTGEFDPEAAALAKAKALQEHYKYSVSNARELFITPFVFLKDKYLVAAAAGVTTALIGARKWGISVTKASQEALLAVKAVLAFLEENGLNYEPRTQALIIDGIAALMVNGFSSQDAKALGMALVAQYKDKPELHMLAHVRWGIVNAIEERKSMPLKWRMALDVTAANAIAYYITSQVSFNRQWEVKWALMASGLLSAGGVFSFVVGKGIFLYQLRRFSRDFVRFTDDARVKRVRQMLMRSGLGFEDAQRMVLALYSRKDRNYMESSAQMIARAYRARRVMTPMRMAMLTASAAATYAATQMFSGKGFMIFSVALIAATLPEAMRAWADVDARREWLEEVIATLKDEVYADSIGDSAMAGRAEKHGGIDLGDGDYLKVVATDARGLPQFDAAQLQRLRQDWRGIVPVPEGIVRSPSVGSGLLRQMR